MGTGSLQEMCEWIEYMTFDGESPLALERAENGIGRRLAESAQRAGLYDA